MQHVTILALPSCLASSISLPVEILNAANEAARSRNRKQSAIQLDIVSSQVGPVKTAGGLSVVATHTTDEISHSDLIILPSLWRNPLPIIKRHANLIPWLQQMASQGSIICAVGTSSYFLAEAGLLKGKPATTHWNYCNQFAKRYPEVNLKRQYLITQANNIFCVGSINSMADVMVHLSSRFYGQAISRLVESQFSPEIRRAFQNHAYSDSGNELHQDEVIIEAQERLRQCFNEAVILADLAAQLDLSIRSFNRRFKQATGITAGQYLHNLRLDNAKELLRTSNLSINEIAGQSGYLDSSYFCARFKKEMGQSPLAYRKSVRGKLFKVI